jgi:hypothetical protein
MTNEIPRDLRLIAAENSLEGDKAAFARCKELSKSLNQLHEHYVKEMLDIVGSKADEYLQFKQKLRDHAREMRSLYTPTPEGEKMKDTFKRKSLAEAREFIKTLGINLGDLISIRKNYQTQIRLTDEKQMNITDTPYVEVTSIEYPKRAESPWIWRNPPYDETYGFQFSDRIGGESTVSHYENSLTGEISCTSDMRNYDADDDDYCFTTATSSILVWYQMPVTGLIETWADLQAIDTYYGGWLHDQFGSSSAGVEQLSRAYLHVVYPSEGRDRYGTLLDYRRFDTEGSWSGNVTEPGSHLYPHLFSMDVYPAGQWVLMRLGVTDFHHVRVNDMSFWSNMVNRWFVRDIPIRSTGVG